MADTVVTPRRVDPRRNQFVNVIITGASHTMRVPITDEQGVQQKDERGNNIVEVKTFHYGDQVTIDRLTYDTQKHHFRLVGEGEKIAPMVFPCTEVSGINRSIAKRLSVKSIVSLQDLVNAPTDEVAEAAEVNGGTAAGWQMEARALLKEEEKQRATPGNVRADGAIPTGYGHVSTKATSITPPPIPSSSTDDDSDT